MTDTTTTYEVILHHGCPALRRTMQYPQNPGGCMEAVNIDLLDCAGAESLGRQLLDIARRTRNDEK